LIPTQLSLNLQLACLKLWSSGCVNNAVILHNGTGMIEVVSNYSSRVLSIAWSKWDCTGQNNHGRSHFYVPWNEFFFLCIY